MKTKDLEQRTKAYKYYCMGLNSKEIGKLLDVSFRTVQNWMHSEKWKESTHAPKPINEKAFDLHSKGMSYNEVAKALKISRSTAYKYVQKALKNEG